MFKELKETIKRKKKTKRKKLKESLNVISRDIND
jgi:hypothetical protein